MVNPFRWVKDNLSVSIEVAALAFVCYGISLLSVAVAIIVGGVVVVAAIERAAAQ